MATRTRVSINREGIGRIAKSETLRSDLHRRAELVAQAARSNAGAGAQIEATSMIGRSRARASVFWVGGLQREIAHRVLGQAIDAAGPGVQIVRERR